MGLLIRQRMGISILALALVLGHATGSQAEVAQPDSDPCQLAGLQVPSISDRQFAFSDADVLVGLGLSKAQRLQVMCEIKNAVLSNYSLIDLKKERLGIDANQVLKGCARTEMQIESPDRQEFFDRVTLCIAQFQDTHFSASSRVARPTLLTAIIASNVDGHVVILKQSPKIVARIKVDDPDAFDNLETFLAPGNEITKVDGVAAAEAVAKLIPYSLSSSPAYTQIAATQNLFYRDFLYPNKRTIAIEVKQANGDLKHLELPWFAQLVPGNYDLQVKFKALGIAAVNGLQIVFDPATNKYVKNEDTLWTVGYTSKLPMFSQIATEVTYNDDSGAPGLRTGEVIVDRDRAFCYMQLLTFASAQFTNTATKIGQPFMAPIQSFLKNCESKKLPLILDLKYNGGGNGTLPAQLLAALSPVGAHFGADVMAFPARSSMVDLIAQGVVPNSTGARSLDQGPDQDFIMTVLADAIHSGQSTTDVMRNPDVTADPKVGGFNQKILAVTSPLCISACDMTAHLLKNSGRATLFGSPSNGTGAGFMSQNKLDSNFQDSLGLMKFQIPNFLFGVETKAGDADRLPYAQYKDLLTENRPTPVDIPYALTAKDFASAGSELEAAVLAALFATH